MPIVRDVIQSFCSLICGKKNNLYRKKWPSEKQKSVGRLLLLLLLFCCVRENKQACMRAAISWRQSDKKSARLNHIHPTKANVP